MASLKEKTKEFLSSMEGYHQKLKELHWSTERKSEHTLVDEIDHEVLEYQDRIAEFVMGYLDTRFGFGDLKTLLPSGTNLKDILSELKSDIADYRKSSEADGLMNILDDFNEDVGKWNYLRTLK